MAELKCPKCGSKYVIKKNEVSDTPYLCQACNHKFGLTEKETGGELIAVLQGDGSDKIEVFKKSDGTFYFVQYRYKEQKTRNASLTLKLINNPYVTDKNNSYYIQVSTYNGSNDPEGMLFAVHKLFLNKDLSVKALNNEALKLMWKGWTYDETKGEFALNKFGSAQIMTDAFNFLNEILPVKKGGCYVATAVYGSYDCPEVWVLRRYRDNVLAKNIFGRAFIHTYYKLSPTFVKLFGEKKWFNELFKNTLDKKVKKLQENGTENTPYTDKNW